MIRPSPSASRAQVFHDDLMLIDRLRPALVRQIGHVTSPSDACGQKLVVTFEDLIARAAYQGLVNVLIGLKIRFSIPRRIGLEHCLMAFLDPREFLCAQMLTCQFSGQLFKHRNHGECVFQLFARDLCNPCAAIGLQYDEPFRGQHLERFAQWRA